MVPSDQTLQKKVHDVRASLAILSGFGDALDCSLTELSRHIDIVLREERPEQETIGKIKTLEADCRFCLSRIRASSAQLKIRLGELDSNQTDSP